MRNDLKENIIQLSRKNTRKKGVFDDELFITALSEFFNEYPTAKNKIFELVRNFLSSRKNLLKSIGIAILDWLKQTDAQTEEVLINQFSNLNFNNPLFHSFLSKIWKFEIKKTISKVISRYKELKITPAHLVDWNKKSLLTMMAECAYCLDNKRGAPLLLEVIKNDFQVQDDNDLYSQTAVILSNLLDVDDLSRVTILFKIVSKENVEIKKYIIEECKKSFDRKKIYKSQNKQKNILKYINEKIAKKQRGHL